MFRASSAHPQEVNVFNCTCMQPLVFSFYCFAVYINGRDTRNLTRGPKFSTKINIYRKWK